MKASQEHEHLQMYRPRVSQGLTSCPSMNGSICPSVPNFHGLAITYLSPKDNCCSWRFDDPRCSSIDGAAAEGLTAEGSKA